MRLLMHQRIRTGVVLLNAEVLFLTVTAGLYESFKEAHRRSDVKAIVLTGERSSLRLRANLRRRTGFFLSSAGRHGLKEKFEQSHVGSDQT